MADDNKVTIDLHANVTGEERIVQITRELAALQSKVAAGDKAATKAHTALNNELAQHNQASKNLLKQKELEADATHRAAILERERITEARLGAQERRVASKQATDQADRARRREESAARREAARQQGVIGQILRSSRAKRDAVLASIAGGKAELADVIKRWGTVSRLQKLENDLRAKAHKDRVNDVQYLEKLKARSLANEARSAKEEKRHSDARLRHLDQQKQAVSSVNQFMNRQIGLLGYRGSIEEKYASKGLKDLRTSMAASLLKYRADMRQQRAADAASGTFDAAANQRIQNRMKNGISAARKTFNANMAFGRAEQQAENARERYKQKMIREGERYMERNRQNVVTRSSQAVSHAGQALSSARIPAIAAMGAAATAGMAVKQGLASARQVDTAETNLRIFGSEPAYTYKGADGKDVKNPGSRMDSRQVAQIRKDWLDRAAITNGLQVPAAINAYTEVLKAGIDPKQARGTTELLLEANAAMDLPLSEVTRIVGKISQNRPNLGIQGTREMLNAMAISAGSTASDPAQIVSGLQRGMGVFAMSNMDPKDLVAMVATGAGAGIQEGKTGNFVAELVSTIMTGGKERGQRKKDLDSAYKMLGMGNARQVSASGEEDITKTLIEMLENFKGLDARQRSLVARRLGGREWDDEIMQFVNSTETLKRTRAANRDSNNSGYLQAGKDERMSSWDGMWSRASATFGLFWSKFGKGFDAILHDISSVFDDLASGFNFDGATDLVRSAFEGMRVALGINTWKEGIQSLFGYASGGFGSIGMQRDVRKFFKGFTEGVMEIGGYFKTMFSSLGVNTSDIAGTGKFTGKVIALSVALLALAPVLSILGGLASLVLMFARIGGVVASVARLGGITAAGIAGGGIASSVAASGAAGAAASGAAGAGAAGAAARVAGGGLGAMLSRFFILGLVAEIGANRVEISAMLTAPIRAYTDRIWEFIKTGFTEGFNGQEIRKFFHDTFKSVKDALLEEMVPAPLRRYLDNKEAEKTPEQKVEEKRIEDAKNGAGLTLLQKMGITAAPPEVKKFAPLVPRIAPNRPAVEMNGVRSFPGLIGPVAPEYKEGETLRDANDRQTKLLEGVHEELKTLNDTTEGAAKVQKQSFQGNGGGSGLAGLIQKASVMSGSTGGASYSNAIMSGGTGGLTRSGSFSSASGPLGSSVPGERLNGGGGLGYRGIIGGSGSERGAGAGVGAGMPMGSRLGGGNAGNYNFGNGPGGAPLGSRMVGFGANPNAYKSTLDYIAKAEGTANAEGGGYNTSLGYGKFLPGGREQKLTDMTLDQISALGNHMRRQPGNPNSSALGRYQIVGNTMRGLMRKMGLSGNEKFDEAMQDRMGAELVRQRGANAHGLGQEWASLTGAKGQQAAALVGQIPGGSSTVPLARPVDSAGSTILSSNGSKFDDGAGLNITGAMRNLRAQGAVMNEQCVSLVKAAAGSSESVRTWQRGVQATDGTLKPGMAVATFMDSMGRQSSRYAGGGTGTMGVNRDHAGIFQEYIKDAAGKNIGMRIAEQYKGSGGVATKDYMFGRGSGAKDGANYAGVLDKDGNVMGMRRPPGATMASPYTTPEAQKDPYSFNALKTPEQLAKDAIDKKNMDAWNSFDGKSFSKPKDAAAVASGVIPGSGWKAGLGPMAEAALKKQAEDNIEKSSGWKQGWGEKGKPYSLMTPAEKLAKQKEDAKNPAYAPGSKIPRAADFNSASSPEEDADIRSRMLSGMTTAQRAAFRKKEASQYASGSKIPKAGNFESEKGKLPQRILDQFKSEDAAKKINDAIVSGAVRSATGVADAIKKPTPTIASDIEKQADTLKSSGWKPKSDPSTTTPAGDGPIVKASIGDKVPPRQPNIQPQMTQAAAKGGGGGSGGNSAGNTINVNGAGMSAEAVANAVQRKLNADTDTRTHDVDHIYA